MIETLFGLALEGHMLNKRGTPHPAPAGAWSATEFADAIVFRKPPAVVQRVPFGGLAPTRAPRLPRDVPTSSPERRWPRASLPSGAQPG